MKQIGVAELPLHVGSCPVWLFSRMVKLSRVLIEIIVDEYGTNEFLKRLSNPFWFQAFGCVLGFDWHSSGLTTTVTGAIKEALKETNLGIAVCGGKGSASRKTPSEIVTKSDEMSVTSKRSEELVRASRLAAKVDNALIQDGYQLYHHVFFFDKKDWCVVQQGMKLDNRTARRYHWFSSKSFVDEPHTGIYCALREENVLDMTAKKSVQVRKISVDLVNDGPEKIKRFASDASLVKFLRMPKHHLVLSLDISKRGWNSLKKAYDLKPENYEELISIRGIGPKTVRALALISEIVYGSEPSWEDPVKFSYTHGGKDGTPYPINRTQYDETIRMLKDAIENAKLGNKEKLWALKSLKKFI